MTERADMATWETWREIHAQPAVWTAWGTSFDPAPVRDWIAGQHFDEIWFCGAGTSAFIGDIVAAGLLGGAGCILRSVPSTDLVARPKEWLRSRQPLVVSFGRSGNSPESAGTLDVLDALAPDAPRLHITCNPAGALAQRPSKGPRQVVVLPETTHDAGFAMTSSFSTMLLTALALLDEPCDFQLRMNAMAETLTGLLPKFAEKTGSVPGRAVYLGNGALQFAAREAALKVLELSAGAIPTLSDSVLGFRHGPKSFVTDDTLICVFTGQAEPSTFYESDLLVELRNQFPKCKVISVGVSADIEVAMPFGATWAAPLCVASAQVSGAIWSNDLGLNVDDPFAGQGTLSRVVADVALYPVAS